MRFVLLAIIALLLLPGAEVSAQVTTNNPLTEVDYPYKYVSADAEFRCTWPSGCGKLRRRSNVVDPDTDPFSTVRVHSVSCDQNGQEGQGCSVSAVFNQLAPDGDIAGPAEVIDRLEEQIERFGITVVEQSPISRDLPGGRRIEGLDLRGRGAKGLGEVWLRGVLSNGDIYVLAAWKMSGGLWDDPEYQVFFDSFIPGTE